ncbi:AUX/IAA protein [Macleaya cordata]|uniref:Auxin-responsive protein n=1 Tax=Macleaya cordata TaxID=56857 RepID=A0A200QDQ8_MACCD|nr:AUX/IAA protein [Macleaya cordata]
MEGGSRNRDDCPQLIDLIHNDRKWVGRENGGNFGRVAEEKKLELKLGPPGEEAWFINENNKNHNSSAKPSFGCFSSMVSETLNSKNQNHKFSSMETQPVGTIFSSSWCPGSSPSPSNFHMKTQQQFQQLKPSYLQFQSVPQNLPAVAKESSQLCNTKVVVELQKNHTEKKACFPTSASVPANTASCNSSQKSRTAPAPVVGWPPIRSFRKNLSNISTSKPASESEYGVLSKDPSIKKLENCKKGLFVKINMDGVPIGRKVDLSAYDSYEKLSSAVDELFRSLLAAQRDSFTAGIHNKIAEVEAITGLLDGTGEYTLVYEDNEGDRMLVGDVPWDMFASTVKRLRVLKSSELSALRLGSSKEEKTPPNSAVKM